MGQYIRKTHTRQSVSVHICSSLQGNYQHTIVDTLSTLCRSTCHVVSHRTSTDLFSLHVHVPIICVHVCITSTCSYLAPPSISVYMQLWCTCTSSPQYKQVSRKVSTAFVWLEGSSFSTLGSLEKCKGMAIYGNIGERRGQASHYGMPVVGYKTDPYHIYNIRVWPSCSIGAPI